MPFESVSNGKQGPKAPPRKKYLIDMSTPTAPIIKRVVTVKQGSRKTETKVS